MANTEGVSVDETELIANLQLISNGLTINQKEVIRLLQNKEVLITNNLDVLITCGTDTKEVTQHSLYFLVKKGLIFLQTEWPFSYVLSASGEIIEV